MKRHDVKEEDIDIAWVPGAFEIPLIADKMAKSKKYDAVICLGTVIRGATSHYDYVCNEVSKGIAQVSLNTGIPVLFGVVTTENIEQAIELGLEVVKFFPAEVNGGVAAIKALAAPYTNMKFMPTGGVNAKNLNDYLSFPKIIACGGSWMVKEDLIEAGDFDKIRDMTREAVQTMLGFELAHIGINAENAEEAESIAKLFEAAFGFGAKVGNSSVFAGTAVEVMKTPYLGKNGHIAIATNYLSRAIAYLKSKGYEFDEDTCKYDAKGNMTAIYFKQDFGGFAVHLVQKK